MRPYQLEIGWRTGYYIDWDGTGLKLEHFLRCRAGLNGVIGSFGAGDWLNLHQLGVL